MASIEKFATVPYIRQRARSLRDYLRLAPLCRDLRAWQRWTLIRLSWALIEGSSCATFLSAPRSSA